MAEEQALAQSCAISSGCSQYVLVVLNRSSRSDRETSPDFMMFIVVDANHLLTTHSPRFPSQIAMRPLTKSVLSTVAVSAANGGAQVFIADIPSFPESGHAWEFAVAVAMMKQQTMNTTQKGQELEAARDGDGLQEFEDDQRSDTREITGMNIHRIITVAVPRPARTTMNRNLELALGDLSVVLPVWRCGRRSRIGDIQR